MARLNDKRNESFQTASAIGNQQIRALKTRRLFKTRQQVVNRAIDALHHFRPYRALQLPVPRL